MIYLDTSALVKKYVIEAGTDKVRDLLRIESRIITSMLAYAEVCAAFSRKRREGNIEEKHYRRIWKSFLSDWETFTIVEIREELFPHIRRLTEDYPLRGADAIHLASAIWVGEAINHPLTFIAADNHLITTAKKEGLQVINPEGD